MQIFERFMAQLIENPAYFKKAAPVEQKPAWEHWEQAMPLLLAVGAIVVLLIIYKLSYPFIKKYIISKISKKPPR